MTMILSASFENEQKIALPRLDLAGAVHEKKRNTNTEFHVTNFFRILPQQIRLCRAVFFQSSDLGS